MNQLVERAKGVSEVPSQYPYSGAYPPMGYTNNVQLGLLTEHMLRRLDESRLLTMSELMKRSHGDRASGPYVQEPASPRPQHALEYKRQTLSPGNGDWKGQIDHICAELMAVASTDKQLRKSIGEPRFGEVMAAYLEDAGDEYVLTVSFTKADKDRNSEQGERTESQVHVRPRRKHYSAVGSKVKKQIEEEPKYEKENMNQEGTLKPYRRFNAGEDSEVLRKAMKGSGTNEEAVTEILAKRSMKQRQEIIRMYKTMFGKDLGRDLKSELSGDYWKVVRALLLHPADYDATELRNAIKGLGTDDDTVIEIICTRTNKSIQLIRESYRRLFNRDLEEDIAGDTSGHFRRLLIALLQANRDESNVVDRSLAKKDAQALHEAGARKWGTDESRFNAILVARSNTQLRATFREYQTLTGKNVVEAIKSETSGDLAAGLLTIVRCVENKEAYFARRLYKAMKGLGTEDDTLVRTVVTRCEVDMVQIKEEFQRNYNQSLSQFINDDTSGEYKRILLTLIGSSTNSREQESFDDDDHGSI